MVTSVKPTEPAPGAFQYSLCRVVLMVCEQCELWNVRIRLSVLALSSRFDGHSLVRLYRFPNSLSVLALSSRFDGLGSLPHQHRRITFSTRSVESF